MSDSLTRAQQLLEQRLQELKAETAQIERVLNDLGASDGRSPARSQPPASKRAGTSRRPARRRRRRLSATEREAALISYAADNPDATNAEIATALGVGSPYVSQLIRKSNKVRRSKGGKLTVKR